MQTVTIFDRSATPVSLCPGRARIKVPRLLHSGAEKERIEKGLAALEQVAAAYANPLTGKVLILFTDHLDPDQILPALGLAAPGAAAKPGAAAAQPQTRRPADAPPREAYPAWHLRHAGAALAHHHSSQRRGLSAPIAAERLRQGPNLLPRQRPHSALALLLSQFANLPTILLAISAGLSLLTGGAPEALAIAAVLLMNGGIGFATERRAQGAIALLSELVSEAVPVLRDGAVREAPTAELVPGDILTLGPGVRVAADARLLEVRGLLLDESALTGESGLVAKQPDALAAPAPLAERSNMVYTGTTVAAGSALAVVVGTGARTELGVIGQLVANTVAPKTPLQKQLDQLGNRLVAISLAICGAVFGIGLLRGQAMLRMFKTSVSLAIAAVPEGLPTAATTSLARGLRQMRARQMLIRRLRAVETLGAIHTICLDKTGTLTMNRMAVVAVRTAQAGYELDDDRLRAGGRPLREGDGAAVARLLQVCVLCNEVGAGLAGPPDGSATENALAAMARNAGVDAAAMRARHRLHDTVLRAEGRNYMATVHDGSRAGDYLIAVKGSPLEVLAMCQSQQCDREVIALDEPARADIARHNEAMAERQLRVLGFAYAACASPDVDPAETGLIWIGLAGLADPLRAGADRLIAELHRAGIRTVMVTGDQRSTAQAIGKSLKLHNGHSPQILDAAELDQAAPGELAAAAGADIFARVSPARKLQIVQALQQSGQVVAMTGDGINDGPAMRAADVGIAMGLHGTDFARSAADVVLQDDRLENVLEAIRLGRTITANIEKSLHFLISSNLSEILLTLSAVSLAGGAPLTPLQLLWMNLLSDVLPAIALVLEEAEADVMQQAPRAAGKALVGIDELRRYALEGGALAAGALGPYLYGLLRHGAGPRARALAFNALVLGQLLHAFSCRSERHGIFSNRQNTRNGKLNLAVGGSIALQLLANLLPGTRRWFGIGKTDIIDIAVTLAGAGVPLLVNEAVKARRGKRRKAAPTGNATQLRCEVTGHLVTSQ